jgi:hypothetical protein
LEIPVDDTGASGVLVGGCSLVLGRAFYDDVEEIYIIALFLIRGVCCDGICSYHFSYEFRYYHLVKFV